MKFSDVKDLNDVEINKKIRETKEKLFDAKMKNTMGQMTSPITIRQMRRDVARLKTVLTMNKKKA